VYYRSAFEQIKKLSNLELPKKFQLLPPFNANLYHWEQEYFFTFMVEGFLGMNANLLRENVAFLDLSTRLGV